MKLPVWHRVLYLSLECNRSYFDLITFCGLPVGESPISLENATIVTIANFVKRHKIYNIDCGNLATYATNLQWLCDG